MKKLLTAGIAAALLVACHTTYQTIPYAQLAAQNIKLPFVKKYEGKNKSLLVYGSYHTNDSTDKQVEDIEKHLTDLSPDIILYEGDYIGFEPTRNASVSTYFEMGLVRWWAQKRGIKDVNLEPPPADKYRYLKSKFSTDQIILATVLGQNILFIKQNSKADFEKLYANQIQQMEKDGFHLTSQQKGIDHFYTIYKAFYKMHFEPQTFDYETVEPKFNKTVLNKISQESAAFRDQHMLKKIDSSLKVHRKVYVQVGGRHALVWQPALNKMTGRK